MIDRLPICLPFTLAQECPLPNDWSNPKNFSNDKHDPGGATMCGIIQREYDLWRKGYGLPTQDVRKMTQEEGRAIYRVSYWLPNCPALPVGLDMQYFDTCVNMGTTEATKILQIAIGVEADGEWGPQTQTAVGLAAQNPIKYIEAFTARREAVYKMLPGFKYFGTDWLRRNAEIGATAAKMAGEGKLAP